MNKPHPHAELMMQYAKDALETDKPWERWEVRYAHPVSPGPWVKAPHNLEWNTDCEYRRKPTPQLIPFTVSATQCVYAQSPAEAAAKFREQVAGELLVLVKDVDGLVHVDGQGYHPVDTQA